MIGGLDNDHPSWRNVLNSSVSSANVRALAKAVTRENVSGRVALSTVSLGNLYWVQLLQSGRPS